MMDAAVPLNLQSDLLRGMCALCATLGSGIALLLFIFFRHAINSDVKAPEIIKKFEINWKKQ
jgi:hypothetical protein